MDTIYNKQEELALREEFKGDFALIYSKPSGLKHIWIFGIEKYAKKMYKNVLNSCLGDNMPFTLVIERY